MFKVELFLFVELILLKTTIYIFLASTI